MPGRTALREAFLPAFPEEGETHGANSRLRPRQPTRGSGRRDARRWFEPWTNRTWPRNARAPVSEPGPLFYRPWLTPRPARIESALADPRPARNARGAAYAGWPESREPC